MRGATCWHHCHSCMCSHLLLFHGSSEVLTSLAVDPKFGMTCVHRLGIRVDASRAVACCRRTYPGFPWSRQATRALQLVSCKKEVPAKAMTTAAFTSSCQVNHYNRCKVLMGTISCHHHTAWKSGLGLVEVVLDELVPAQCPSLTSSSRTY